MLNKYKVNKQMWEASLTVKCRDGFFFRRFQKVLLFSHLSSLPCLAHGEGTADVMDKIGFILNDECWFVISLFIDHEAFYIFEDRSLYISMIFLNS